MSLLELMNACPNIAVVHIGEKTQVIKDTNRCDSTDTAKQDTATQSPKE